MKPSTNPKALDLCCGAGGVSAGLVRAGFQVVGVDIVFQKNYPFPFVQFDAVQMPMDYLRQFDFIWASPPCQAYTDMKHAPNTKGDAHPKLIEPLRDKLRASGKPYCIENVEGAPLIDPVILCGSMFGLGTQGCQLRRHRLFEASFPIEQPECKHSGPVIGVYGGHARRRAASAGGRGTRDVWVGGHKAAAAEAMGIDWMTLDEVSEAIPPAFAEHIGRAAMAHVTGRFALAAE